MKRIPVESSNVASIGYDPHTQTLEVEFRSDGAVYQYADVPPEVHLAFMGAPSKGRYFSATIRNHYQAARVKEEERHG